MKKTTILLSLMLAALSPAALSAPSPDSPDATPAAPREKTCAELAKADASDVPAAICAGMSLEDKISQMVMSYPPLAKEGPVTVGAVIMLGPTIKNAKALTTRVKDLQARAKVPLLVAVDMEGGQLNRLQFVPELKNAPSGKALGAMTEEDAEAWGRTLGSQMKSLGLNCNLGPVLDLAAKGHMFDRERSLGGDPAAVAKIGGAYVRGMWSQGVVGFGKHFPGYGDTDLNSDHDLVVSPRSETDLKIQAQPFYDVGDALGGVLLTNIAFEKRGGVPAILSKDVVDMAHRKVPGWVAMTDDIAVAPLLKATGGDGDEVVRRAFLAGNDIILTTAPVDWEKTVDIRGIIKAEVEKAPSLASRVDASVLRILRLKERMGLLDAWKKKAKQKGPRAKGATSPSKPQAGAK